MLRSGIRRQRDKKRPISLLASQRGIQHLIIMQARLTASLLSL
ncbi:hypothetical protein EDWATA_01147 [Edwardsiella tarda ATCC 23685]|uniref:Uncharacterized protein n=1 Tax=Edwardsiella tarda ATCC 23685 TaxID=500638 RepID=D4F345_EDWTA|nr:hypothetical protein EDWATA_01147 [Edwardsiella tarda ATCC 23685]